MYFNFINKLTAFESGISACGTKQLTQCQQAFCNKDGLYPMFLIEAIGQLNAWVTMELNAFQVRPVAILYGNINLYGSAKIGDTLDVETTLLRVDKNSSLFNGSVRINSTLVAEVVEAAGSFLDINQFAYQDEYVRQFTALKGAGLSDATDHTIMHHLMQQDAILEKNATKIITQKTITDNYAFFKEHFPRKPVLPISILLQNAIESAKQFVDPTNAINFTAIQLQRIKMRDFIMPNAVVLTKINVIANNESCISCTLDITVENKNICRGTIHLHLPISVTNRKADSSSNRRE